jgi:hypothetical protein
MSDVVNVLLDGDPRLRRAFYTALCDEDYADTIEVVEPDEDTPTWVNLRTLESANVVIDNVLTPAADSMLHDETCPREFWERPNGYRPKLVAVAISMGYDEMHTFTIDGTVVRREKKTWRE